MGPRPAARDSMGGLHPPSEALRRAADAFRLSLTWPPALRPKSATITSRCSTVTLARANGTDGSAHEQE